MKRINPATNKPFRRGDTREDGSIFTTYAKTKVLANGYFKESWLTPEAFERSRVSSRDAIKKWQSVRYLERAALVSKIKTDRGCSNCGYNKHACALDFDHKDPEIKRFNIGSSHTYKMDVLLDELSKCRILCANCHRLKTNGLLNPND